MSRLGFCIVQYLNETSDIVKAQEVFKGELSVAQVWNELERAVGITPEQKEKIMQLEPKFHAQEISMRKAFKVSLVRVSFYSLSITTHRHILACLSSTFSLLSLSLSLFIL